VYLLPVLGACFINLDIILHVVPSWRSFNIRQSTTFLAASLSLSFGVMVRNRPVHVSVDEGNGLTLRV